MHAMQCCSSPFLQRICPTHTSRSHSAYKGTGVGNNTIAAQVHRRHHSGSDALPPFIMPISQAAAVTPRAPPQVHPPCTSYHTWQQSSGPGSFGGGGTADVIHERPDAAICFVPALTQACCRKRTHANMPYPSISLQ